MKMSIKGFKKLKGIAKKTRCKIKITERHGLPFLLDKYKNRKAFMFGVLFFVAALYALSSFVWVIEISGNERIKKATIVSYSEDMGLKPGAFKFNLDTKKIENGFLTTFSDISWIAVEVKGTKATINLTETIEKLAPIDNQTPCDIVAASDALVTDIYVIAGTPNVSVGDVVKKWDTLVSGVLQIKDGEEVLGEQMTHARAEVRGKVVYTATLAENIHYIRKDYTEKEKKTYAINILENKFDFSKINTSILYNNYDKITYDKLLNIGGDFALPISLTVTKYSEYVPMLINRGYDKTSTLLLEKLDLLIAKKFEGEDVSVLDKSVNFTEEVDKVILDATVTVEKRIDTERAMNTEDFSIYNNYEEGE